MKRARKYKVDEWVSYCQFPDSSFAPLSDERKSAVILEVLPYGNIYDYRIFIDDGTATTRKVKEENLFPHHKTK